MNNSPPVEPFVLCYEKCFCGGSMRPLVAGPFYVLQKGQRVELPSILYWCEECDLTIRGLDYGHPVVASHYELASYTQPETEESYKSQRLGFLRWIHRVATSTLGKAPDVVVDFGCSYGHLLDVFHDAGTRRTIGVEIASKMVAKLKSNGVHEVFSSLSAPEIGDGSIDILTSIDSLYCVPGDPLDALRLMSQKIRPRGLLVTRTTNRNQVYGVYSALWKLRHGFGRGVPSLQYSVVGDANFGFSQKALCSRFDKVGLKLIGAHRWEPKKVSLSRKLFNVAALGLYHASMHALDFCTGLVLVAKKE